MSKVSAAVYCAVLRLGPPGIRLKGFAHFAIEGRDIRDLVARQGLPCVERLAVRNPDQVPSALGLEDAAGQRFQTQARRQHGDSAGTQERLRRCPIPLER